MQHFLSTLLIGLTTVFAWAPASILLFLAGVGVHTGVLYFDEVGILRLLALCLLSVCAVLGYIALTSICWGLKLKTKFRLICLVSGTLALIAAITLGHFSGNPLLQISLNIEQIYLFVCPLIFLILHVARDAKQLSQSK